jgi:hypothetical protein
MEKYSTFLQDLDSIICKYDRFKLVDSHAYVDWFKVTFAECQRKICIVYSKSM